MWDEYCRFSYLNWAVKFYAALIMLHKLSGIEKFPAYKQVLEHQK